MKSVRFLSAAVAVAALSLSASAFAGNGSGNGPSGAWPPVASQHVQSSEKTRAQVRAELAQAQADGTMAALHAQDGKN